MKTRMGTRLAAGPAMSAAPTQSAVARGLHLWALSGFAVAQPLLALVAEHPPFLVAHRAGRLEIALLLFALLSLVYRLRTRVHP